jgi:hypothetical protein
MSDETREDYAREEHLDRVRRVEDLRKALHLVREWLPLFPTRSLPDAAWHLAEALYDVGGEP